MGIEIMVIFKLFWLELTQQETSAWMKLKQVMPMVSPGV